ncbi:DMT family transporter [Marinihelvus fidelis]|uniref:DMT family transporter n=1 Tax=Marinihelvus fidelis TaxID=2613842 RepID=A0A5N0TE83_9GAMM|nr:DMT family transporter [Marinihelvus fidelis]KAA9133345.1 DMT family transporter [Marinihelvus fidelis]
MSTRDLLLVLGVSLVWGFNFVAGAKGMQAFTPLQFVTLRFACVLLITLPFLRRPAPGHWLQLAGAGIFLGALHFTFLQWALQLSADVTSVTILQNMSIPFAVLLAMLFLGERAGWRTLTATGVAFTGVLIIGLDPLVLQQSKALMIVLCSALFQALGSVLMRGLRGISTFSFQAWSSVFSLPILVGAMWVLEPEAMTSLGPVGPWHWAALAYSIFMASLVGHGVFFILVQRNPLPTVMPYLLTMPVFGTIFGVLVWGDRPGWRLLLGGTMVLSGILVITLRGRRKAIVPAAVGD